MIRFAHWTRVQEHNIPIWLTEYLDGGVSVCIQSGFVEPRGSASKSTSGTALNVLAVVSKDEIPAKMQSLLPEIETRGVQRARLAMTLNQQRKTGTQLDPGTVREDAQ